MKEIFKSGHYGLVSLTSENLMDENDKVFRSERLGIGPKLRRFFSGRRNLSEEEVANTGLVVRHILEMNRVSQKDLELIPLDPSNLSEIRRANFLAMMSRLYDQMFLAERRKGSDRKYELGLIMADFFEVIKSELSSRIILSAAEPNIARTIVNNEGITNVGNVDTQVLAVEAFVLLPTNSRRETFSEMVNMYPGREGRARRFLSLLSSNWSNRNSAFCGSALIYANLSGEEASTQILDVQGDLGLLLKIIEKSNI